jgi:chromosomal replication initiator protein
MIDDIQQFVEKDRINNLFFALINDIINRKKKIIVASDKAPTQLIGIDVRNISRLSSQMMTTITRPKIEDIKKIIKDKFAK